MTQLSLASTRMSTNLHPEELEIIEFYREGLSVTQIAECTGFSQYQLKKLLETYRKIQNQLPCLAEN